jgi:hypothetical protein
MGIKCDERMMVIIGIVYLVQVNRNGTGPTKMAQVQ